MPYSMTRKQVIRQPRFQNPFMESMIRDNQGIVNMREEMQQDWTDAQIDYMKQTGYRPRPTEF